MKLMQIYHILTIALGKRGVIMERCRKCGKIITGDAAIRSMRVGGSGAWVPGAHNSGHYVSVSHYENVFLHPACAEELDEERAAVWRGIGITVAVIVGIILLLIVAGSIQQPQPIQPVQQQEQLEQQHQRQEQIWREQKEQQDRQSILLQRQQEQERQQQHDLQQQQWRQRYYGNGQPVQPVQPTESGRQQIWQQIWRQMQQWQLAGEQELGRNAVVVPAAPAPATAPPAQPLNAREWRRSPAGSKYKAAGFTLGEDVRQKPGFSDFKCSPSELGRVVS